jgi:hypothetical protein
VKAITAMEGLPIGGTCAGLRRGLLTAGSENRAALADLMRQPRHRSVTSVLGYVEAEDLWRNNVTEGVFHGQSNSDAERVGDYSAWSRNFTRSIDCRTAVAEVPNFIVWLDGIIPALDHA